MGYNEESLPFLSSKYCQKLLGKVRNKLLNPLKLRDPEAYCHFYIDMHLVFVVLVISEMRLV